MTERNPDEQVTVTDKRRIDPETGEVRHVPPGADAGRAAPAARGRDCRRTADKVAELTADLQRVQADFANYRKRALRDQQAAADRAKAAVVSQLLGVLDDLDRARKHGDLESGPLKSVADKLIERADRARPDGVRCRRRRLRPGAARSRAARRRRRRGSRPVIGTVMRQGYRLGEHVLRHALVGVVDTVPGTTAGRPMPPWTSPTATRTPNQAITPTPQAIRAQNPTNRER